MYFIMYLSIILIYYSNKETRKKLCLRKRKPNLITQEMLWTQACDRKEMLTVPTEVWTNEQRKEISDNFSWKINRE